MAVVPHTAQQRFHHGFVSQKVLPLVIFQVGRDDGGVAVIAFLHQLEKRVGLFGFEIHISEFVDKCSAEHLSTNVKLSEMWS